MDPLRSEARPAEALSGSERDARIEQLLLAGLDEYFAHRYEHAINLWTRVLFLDRQHDRARAYIERARRAQAERQRESEAALHQAVAAFHAGDVARARALVTDALDRGAPPEDAHGMLERIERLAASQLPGLPAAAVPKPAFRPASRFLAPEPVQSHPGEAAGLRQVRHRRPAAVLLAAAAAGILLVGVWGLAIPDVPDWMLLPSSSVSMQAPPAWTPEPLPLPQASEFHLARARGLLTTGRLRDALSFLDRIPLGDPLRREADRMRAEIQRQLLTMATTERPRE